MNKRQKKRRNLPANGISLRLVPWILAGCLMCAVILGAGAFMRKSYWNRCLECIGAAAEAGVEEPVLDAFVFRAGESTREKGREILSRCGYAGTMENDWMGRGVAPLAEGACCAAILGLLLACGMMSRRGRDEIRQDIETVRGEMEAYLYGRDDSALAEKVSVPAGEEGRFPQERILTTAEGRRLTSSWEKVCHGIESQQNALATTRVQMGQFLENISHQLKTPLTAVLLQLDLLLETVPEAAARDHLALCYRQSLRIQQMIRVLLNLARLDSGKVVFHFRREDMQALVAGCMEEIRPLAEEKNIVLSFQVESRNPEEFFYVCDRFWMKEAIDNIGKNAIDYAPEGTEVSFEMYRNSGNLYIGISDQGKGIPEKDRERIFERFYQGERGESAAGSVGIGLSLAHDIVRKYRGSLTVECPDSGGTTFWIRLPDLTGKDKEETTEM